MIIAESNPFIDSGAILIALCKDFDVDYKEVAMCPAIVWTIIVQIKKRIKKLIEFLTVEDSLQLAAGSFHFPDVKGD